MSKRWTILTCQFAVLKCAVVVNSPWFAHAMTRIHTAFSSEYDHIQLLCLVGILERNNTVFWGRLLVRVPLKTPQEVHVCFPNHPWGRNHVQPKNHVEQYGVVFFLLSGLFCTSMTKSCIIVFSDDSNGGCSH